MTLLRHGGNADLWTAAWLSAEALARGVPLHLHAEGPRGTGKTSVLRSIGRQLPPIRRVRGCPYNCDPEAPHCPAHRGMAGGEVRDEGTEIVPAPFLELSASAKLATAVGSIDLARLLDRERPEAALLPGTLARAHRGVVFVDEINRLADVAPELTDALLDVMGTKPGRLQVEEAGLPTVELPVAVTVWAASNPDEDPGPLDQTRLQLSDRFDLRVAVQPPADLDAVLEVLRGFQYAAPAGAAPPDGRADALPARFGSRGEMPAAEGADAAGTPWPEGLLRFVAGFYLRSGLGSLRALQAWQQAAEGLARLGGRRRPSAADVRLAARLTLRGRVGAAALDGGLRGIEAIAGGAADDPGAGEDGAAGAEEAGTRAEEGGATSPSADAAGAEAGGDRPEARPPSRIGEVDPMVSPEWSSAGAAPPGGGIRP